MSLFPDIKIDGHGRYDGLDPNGGSLQKVIQRNLFVEADRGQAFRRKLASVLERIKTPIVMPRLEPGDFPTYYPLSVVVKDVDLQFVTEKPADSVPAHHVRLRRNE